jgi:hypothetical protein
MQAFMSFDEFRSSRQSTAGEPLDVSDRSGRLESEAARIAGVFQETNRAISAESAGRMSFERMAHADVQDRFWSYRSDIAMFMKDIALSVNDFSPC